MATEPCSCEDSRPLRGDGVGVPGLGLASSRSVEPLAPWGAFILLRSGLPAGLERQSPSRSRGSIRRSASGHRESWRARTLNRTRMRSPWGHEGRAGLSCHSRVCGGIGERVRGRTLSSLAGTCILPVERRATDQPQSTRLEIGREIPHRDEFCSPCRYYRSLNRSPGECSSLTNHVGNAL